MFEIVSNDNIGPQVYKLRISAAKIARKRQAGQFVIVRVGENDERLPLTIADSDPAAGTITLVVQAVGRSTKVLCGLRAGETIRDVVGPLGQATHIAKIGRVAIIGGGIGTAVAMPIAQAMKAVGNEVTVIIGGRSREFVILEDELRRIADRVVVTTDDGSYGRKGLVTEPLQKFLAAGEKFDLVVAIGPVPMMEAVCQVTRAPAIATMVSLNPLMIDGTGMCGGCRVTVGGQTKFACVDGPEFDGHQVDFAELRKRLGTFREAEQEAHRHYDQTCRLAAAATTTEGGRERK